MLRSTIRPTITMLAGFTLLLGVVYPAVSTGIAKVVFPAQAEGSLVYNSEGKVQGSALIGQEFTGNGYFWGRLSATSPKPYNASASSGSNLGMNNPALLDTIKARIAALKAADPHNNMPIPVDLVTASGSGLDPHISLESAEYQASRIAKARNLSEAKIEQLVQHYAENRQFGVLGEPRINVLKLNLALDKDYGKQ